MYSDNKTIQILISLLKEFNIKYAVLSPGTRNVPLVHSLEMDEFFHCHSVVDERSAAYFALGMAMEKKQPVMISCTSGTASVNYTSAVCEAYEQQIPLLVLTADRNQYFLNQLEDQMIPQSELYRGRVRKQVTLPIIKDEKDFWYCRRLVNEALIELYHNGSGPVHINIPTEWGLFAQNFNTKELPKLKPIYRISRSEMYRGKIEEVEILKSKKKVLVIYGQNRPVSEKMKKNIDGFVSKYNCVFAVENISNIDTNANINTNLICRALDKELFSAEFAPDLVISLNGNYVSTIKGLLKGCTKDFEHWTVNEEGKVVDQFRKLNRVFECSAFEFFEYFNNAADNHTTANDYLKFWRSTEKSLEAPYFTYSSNYAMQEFMKRVPANSLVHYGNGVSVHMSQYFSVDSSIIHYCHSGTTTIDGSLSTFIGQAAGSDKLCFMFIGDLSFFYDMNALWNRYVGSNVRILIYNNEGGETFHWNAAKEIETLPLHTSAEHFTNAKGWVETRGFKYLSASNKEEFDSNINQFMIEESDKPICFEVFSKKDEDAKILLDYYKSCREKINQLISERIK